MSAGTSAPLGPSPPALGPSPPSLAPSPPPFAPSPPPFGLSLSKPPLEPAAFLELCALYADYAAALDAGEWQRWPGFFTDPCVYKLQPRENFDRGLPLCTLSFESRGMLEDRVYGISETLFHDPYYQRHVIGLPRLLSIEPGGDIRCEVHYAVFRTKPSQPSSVFNVGRSLDRVRRTEAGLRFAEKLVVFDSELIPNSIIYPI